MIRDNLNLECKKRIELVEEIACKCSMEYGKEIIITGSVSRGLGDENSDVEIEFLVDALMPVEDRINWIRGIGGTEIVPYGAPIIDGSEWIIFKYKGCWVEGGWQTFEAMRDNVKSIVEGKFYTHDRLILASTLKNAIIIRDNGFLRDIKENLSFYSDELQQKIIRETIGPWTVDLGLKVRKVLSERGDKIPLLQRMIPDVHRILRILYALNKKWEPDWKWINHIAEDLNTKPDKLIERIDSIVCIENPNENLKNCFELIKDTVSLIPEELELDDVIIKIVDSINSLN